MEKKPRYTVAIVVMFLLFGMISFVTNLASPLSDILTHQFNIPNWQGTLGVFANFIAYALMGYPAGIILHRVGYKKTALVAVVVGFVGVGIQTLSGFLASYGVYLVGAFVAGFCMCLLNTVVNPMLTRLGGGGNKGNQLIQYAGTFNSLCGTAVIVLTGLLIPQGIDKAAIANVFPLMFTAMAVFVVAFVVISLTTIPEQPAADHKDAAAPQSPLFSHRHFVLGLVAIFLYVGVEVSVPQLLQKWLQNPTLDVLGDVSDEAVAGSVAASYWLLMLVGRFIGGLLGGRVSARSMLTATSALAVVLVVIAMVSPLSSTVLFPGFNGAAGFGLVSIPISAALLASVGLCTSVMWGGIFTLAVAGLGSATEKASGIFMTMVCGGGILPLLQNAVVDTLGPTGYLPSYAVVVVGFVAILLYAQLGSRTKSPSC